MPTYNVTADAAGRWALLPVGASVGAKSVVAREVVGGIPGAATPAASLTVSALTKWFWDFVNDRGALSSSGAGVSSFAAAVAAGQAAFSRASSGYYQQANGVWVPFASNALRRGDRGALIEPAATNLIRNSTAAGAVAGSPGSNPSPGWATLTAGNAVRTIVGTTTINGLPALVMEWVCTALSNPTIVLYADTPAATGGLDYVGGAYLQLISGTPPNQFSWQIQEGAGGSNVVLSTFTLDAAFTRRAPSRTLSAGATQGRYQLLAQQAGYSGTFRMAVAAPQFELGTVATSPIDTSGTTATRAADALTLFPPAGTYDITVTFDDDSTQVLTGQTVTGSGWQVPTNLNRPYIKSIGAV